MKKAAMMISAFYLLAASPAFAGNTATAPAPATSPAVQADKKTASTETQPAQSTEGGSKEKHKRAAHHSKKQDAAKK